MVDQSVMKLFQRTLPFFIARILIYGIFGLVALIFLGIVIGVGFLFAKLFGDSSGAFIILMLIAFGVVYGGLKFVERYVLYIVKIGHVSVIVELLRTGSIPEGKGQVAYGKEQVTKNFGTANVAFVLDQMVHATVRQIQRWILRVGELFSFIPGHKNILGVLNAILSVSLNYIDEAIVSYIFVKKREGRNESVWKLAGDGVVLYAQSWKAILKTAAISVIMIYLFNIVVFLMFTIPFMFISKLLTSNAPETGFLFGALALVAAYVVTTVLKRALVDPIVTIAMIRAYQMGIQNLEPAIDMEQQLMGVSSKFRNLVERGRQET